MRVRARLHARVLDARDVTAERLHERRLCLRGGRFARAGRGSRRRRL